MTVGILILLGILTYAGISAIIGIFVYKSGQASSQWGAFWLGALYLLMITWILGVVGMLTGLIVTMWGVPL